ncbi:MAG TPA: hypothetical protein VHD33_05185, partial [Legionellaceae bacterium]|nr:hypothetical protein [Legionellaceae bacterium]
MTEYIAYNPDYNPGDPKSTRFIKTGLRPNNQGNKEVLKKIAQRLEEDERKKPGSLTETQRRFLVNYRREGARYLRSLDNIDIAHNVAISQIMETLAFAMNNPGAIDFDATEHFFNEILSTSSDEGALQEQIINRKRIKNFLTRLKNGPKSPEESEKLLKEVNLIIEHVNKCSRNLFPGNDSENRTISDDEDPPFYYVPENTNYATKVARAFRISEAFKSIPGNENYGPKTYDNGGIRSSSLPGEALTDEVTTRAFLNQYVRDSDATMLPPKTDAELAAIYSQRRIDYDAKAQERNSQRKSKSTAKAANTPPLKPLH